MRPLRAIGFIILLFTNLYLSPVQAAVEFKSSIFSSLSFATGSDIILNSHNTVLVGGELVRVGPYLAYETKHSYQRDLTLGLALRAGKEYYGELQLGSLTRNFDDYSNLKATGYVINLVAGWHITETIGLSLVTSAKRIEEGMDKRWTIGLLPYLGVRFEL